MKNIVVIGGGIIGLSSAYYLRRAGHQVTVIDREGFTDNCSYGNLGYVCPSHFIPLAAPGIIWQGFKWMFNSRSPFYVQPALNSALINWGLKFIRSSTKRNVASAAGPLADIAFFSQTEYFGWTKAGIECSLEQKGMLEIFKTAKAGEHALHTVEKGKKLGLDVELLDAKALQNLEPQTEVDAAGAIYFKDDAHLYPDQLMNSLKLCLSGQGVELVKDEVTGFEKSGKHITKVLTTIGNDYDADDIVIANGSWSRELAAMLKTNIPLMPGRGYSFTLDNPRDTLNHPAILVEGRVAITPFQNGKRMRYGGTMEVVSTKTPPRYQRVEGIVHAVRDYFPAFKLNPPRIDQIWYGYRPVSADGLPYIGKIKSYENVVVATGHSMLGLSLGAGTGKLVNELVNGHKTSLNIKPFAVERFG